MLPSPRPAGPSLLRLAPLVLLGSFPGGLCAQAAGAGRLAERTLAPVPDHVRVGFESITPEVLRPWLGYLASDELGGRATGRPGFMKAAKYVAARFEELGLEPIGDDKSYFQKVPFEGTRVDAESSWLALEDAGGKVLFKVGVGEGFGGRIREKASLKAAAVFLRAREAADVEGSELGGKIVFLDDRSERSRFGMRRAQLGLRRLRARPAAIVAVDDDAAASGGMRVVFKGRSRRPTRRRPNGYAIRGEKLLELLGRAGVEAALDEDAPTGLWELSDHVVETHVEVLTEPVFAANVVGLLEGSDPKLAAEVVGVGSHLDHIGTRANGQINNGADDDGSGSSGVLALARAFQLNKAKPKRSILFMCFCGEELGLIGSGWYADHPILPHDRMVAELQMDMIGRNEENLRTGEKPEDNLNSLHLIGTKKLSDELHEICIAANERYVGFDFEYDEEDVFFRSDHVNFARKNIPIAFFFTGFHPQYHRPDDTIDRIDFPKLARVVKLVYLIAFDLADRDARPKLDRTYDQIAPRGGRRR